MRPFLSFHTAWANSYSIEMKYLIKLITKTEGNK